LEIRMDVMTEGFRLSPRQRRLWALHGGAGDGAAWAAVRVAGPVGDDALRRALLAVAERHEVLRTRFVREASAGVPVQEVGDAAVEWAPAQDWRGATAAEVQARLLALAGAGLPPALTPLHATLVRTGEAEHLLLVRASPLAADTATLRALPAELARVHAGSPAQEGGLQYVDVSEWQHDALEGDDAAEGRRFWQSRPAAPVSRLPAEREGSGDGDPRVLRLPADPALLAAAGRAAAALDLSMDAVLQGAFHLLLHRLAGAEAVTVAAELDGRSFDELKGAPGPFARPLPFTTRMADDATAASVVAAVAFARADAEPWQDFFSGDALPPFAFAWHPAAPAGEADGLRFSLYDASSPAERFRLLLACDASEDGLALRLDYDAATFADEAAARLADGYRALLADLAARPDSSAAALAVMGDDERAEVLERFPRGPAAGVPAGTVVEWIEAQAARTPDRPAVVCEGDTLTYAQLIARVHARAARLRSAGVGAEARVALLMARSADTVAWLLGAMRAGGAYLPLDPSTPIGRLRSVAADAGATVVVADDANAAAAAELGIPILRATGDGGVDAAIESPSEPIDPRRLAYVIYTSGTTGGPKGIGVAHAALAQYVAGVSRTLALPDGARWAMVSTFAADLGGTMLFPALCSGGTLHVVTEARATDPEAFAEYAAAHGIDALKIVPSHLRLLLDADRPERVIPRARLVLGGEASDWALVDRVRALSPGCTVFNHYGPTESTVGVLAGELSATDGDARPAAPPLGRPLPGVAVYLLDAALCPVPAGVPGELFVGGGSLARGYVGRAALTAERFVPDPYGAVPGGRLYCTGDRARWLSGGRVAFLGRADDQVKVAGHRIEPAEVAAALAAHPAVEVCRVAPHGEGEAVRLVAWMVAAAGQEEPEPAALRRFLAERLPDPMIPSAFVFLRSLPLTPNGKLDLRALPSPDTRAASAGSGTAPRTEGEARLAAVWREVLGLERVGVDDDFFALGGNSFLAVRLMSRIHRELGRRVLLAALVAAGTVARMAALLAEDGDAAAPDHFVVLAPGAEGEAPLVCVHPGEGTVFCYHALAAHLDPALPVWGVQALDFELGRAPLVRIGELAERYVDALLARHQGPVRLAGWSFGGLVAFEMARRLEAAGRQVERVFLFDCRLPVTARAFGEVDPVLFRLGMLFDPRLLVDDDGRTRVAPAELDGLPLAAQLALVSARTGIPAEQLVPSHLPADTLERYLDLRIARAEAVIGYDWAPCEAGITLFRASTVELDTPFPAFRDAYLRAEATPDYGWGALTAEGVEVVAVPGTHHSIFDEPNVRELARAVEVHLPAAAAVR
jgi:amino acid adenylation domain-containing protein